MLAKVMDERLPVLSIVPWVVPRSSRDKPSTAISRRSVSNVVERGSSQRYRSARVRACWSADGRWAARSTMAGEPWVHTTGRALFLVFVCAVTLFAHSSSSAHRVLVSTSRKH